jgi:hypothetical protein
MLSVNSKAIAGAFFSARSFQLVGLFLREFFGSLVSGLTANDKDH